MGLYLDSNPAHWGIPSFGQCRDCLCTVHHMAGKKPGDWIEIAGAVWVCLFLEVLPCLRLQ